VLLRFVIWYTEILKGRQRESSRRLSAGTVSI